MVASLSNQKPFHHEHFYRIGFYANLLLMNAQPSHPHPPDTAPQEERLDLRVVQALRRVIRAVDLYSKKLYASHKVTGPQLLALDLLRNEGAMSPAALSRALHVSASTVTGIADRLEAKGLLERRRDTSDRRVVRLHLSPAGGELLLAAPSPLQDKLLAGLNGLPELERTAIAMSLERVVDLMEAEDVDAAPILTQGSLVADAPPVTDTERMPPSHADDE